MLSTSHEMHSMHELDVLRQPSPASLPPLKRKQTRTSNACERCKARKQKCVALTAQGASPSTQQPCRNCHESMSQCVFGPKPVRARAKKQKQQQQQQQQQEQEQQPTQPTLEQETQHTQVPMSMQRDSVPISNNNNNNNVSPPPPPFHPPSPTISNNNYYDDLPPPLPPVNQINNNISHNHFPSQFQNSFTQHYQETEQQARQATAFIQSLPSLPPLPHQSSHRSSSTSASASTSTSTSASTSVPSTSLSTSLSTYPPFFNRSQSHPYSHSHSQPEGSRAASLSASISRNQYTSPSESCTTGTGSIDTETSIEENAARGVAYISLEAAAESHYVGQSSGATWASLILNGIAASNSIVPKVELRSEHLEKKPIRPESDLRLPSAVAAFVLETVYRHIQPRYPFMDWIVLHNHWQDRDKYITAAIEGRLLERDESSIAFLILVTIAVGTQLCSRAEMRLPPSEEYYKLSLQYMDSIVQLHNLPNVQALLLLAMYSLHDSKGPSVWYLSGVAIRLCIGMGLHRRASPLQARTLSRYTLEMRKRIFWTAYTLDRTMAMSLGRPPGIADADIDVELPDDVDCVDISQDPRKGSTTSMTSSIHVIKLMRIQSKIQMTAYRVDQAQGPKDTHIWGIIGLLDDWEKGIPEAAASKDCWKVPCCSQEWFRNKSAEARLYLLRPSLVGPNAAESPFLTHAAQSAAFIGTAQRRLHQQGQPLSSSALYTLFLAGLTLLYAVYIRPTLLPSKEVFQAVRAFSNTLFSYSQTLKIAEPLHNIFEELSLHCLERMNSRPEQSHPEATKAKEKSAPSDWQEALFGTTNEINAATAGEFASLFESLGLPSGAGLQATDYEPLPTNGTGTGLDMDPFLLDFSWSQPLELDWNL